MDEAIEKKVRSLKLKLLMAERELHAASGKWRLGALLKAGHANAMNREVDKVTARLDAQIEKLKKEIAELTGEPLEKAASEQPKPAPKVEVKQPDTVKKAEAKPAAKKSEAKSPATKTASKKSAKK